MAGKTINHKGKLLHKHVSGFYIDLLAFIEFSSQPLAFISNLPTQCLVLLNRTNVAEPDENGGTYSLKSNHELLRLWTINEIVWQSWLIGKQTSLDVAGPIGSKYNYILPFLPTATYRHTSQELLGSDWFPMSACYSPARIALENVK